MSVYDPYSSGGDAGLTSKKNEPPSTAWMLTVADLFSLMLTFFVLLYSMSEIQREQWDAISSSLMQRVVTVESEEISLPTESWQIARADFVFARGLDYLNKIIAKRFESSADIQGVLITRTPDRITLSLTSDSMFKAGSADVQDSARETLRQISQFLGTIGNSITIEGHTDPRPINTKSYPSNWELSLARSLSVANALRDTGYPYAIDVYGRGSSRYGELKDLSPEKRDQLSRRVDIIVRETVAKH